MHLYDLTDPELADSLRSPRAEPGAPEWALGCFRRRSITFADGREDTTTEVFWLQSRGLTADFRRPAGTPRASSLQAIARLGPEPRVALARVEGGMARTRWDGALMSWTGWESFQSHARWPEAGRLARVGGCLTEHAPSGAYVEDWRLEPCGEGPLIGLWLLEERDAGDGALMHRGGGLLVCGRRAALVRGRPAPLPAGERLEALVTGRGATPERLAAVFSFDAALATAPGARDAFTVTLGTQPWREGEPLSSLEGFEIERGQVVQRLEEGGRPLIRRFVVDTLERSFVAPVATAVTPEGRSWLEREHGASLGARADAGG